VVGVVVVVSCLLCLLVSVCLAGCVVVCVGVCGRWVGLGWVGWQRVQGVGIGLVCGVVRLCGGVCCSVCLSVLE
jgi:hypothetical protein